MSREHPNHVIVKINQNTEKSSGDLRGLAFTQTPVKEYRQKLMWNFNRNAQNSFGFWVTNGWSKFSQITRPNDIQQKTITCRSEDFVIPADYRIKIKENEKWDKFLDLARELKKLWNMKVTVIPIVLDLISSVTKEMVQGLEDW